MIKKLKKVFPFIILILFITFIYSFFKNNKNDFNFIYNLNIKIILEVIFLCFLYLITESIIFKKITNYFNKDINIFSCFLIICSTYLCNTFIQFSGLGFRAYYLKKIKQINFTDFLLLSLFIILIEVFLFSGIGFLSLIILDILNLEIRISPIITIIIFFIFLSSLTIFFYYDKIYYFLINLIKIQNFKYIKKISYFLEKINKKKLRSFLLSFITLFFFQFSILFFIFYLGYSILEKENSILFSIIATISTDLSFLFTFTPYAIGISEAFIFFSSYNFDIKIAEILFLTNFFRLSMFIVYFFLGWIYLYFFLKKFDNTK